MLDRARSMLLNRAKETVNENYSHKIIGSSVLKSTGNCHNFQRFEIHWKLPQFHFAKKKTKPCNQTTISQPQRTWSWPYSVNICQKPVKNLSKEKIQEKSECAKTSNDADIDSLQQSTKHQKTCLLTMTSITTYRARQATRRDTTPQTTSLSTSPGYEFAATVCVCVCVKCISKITTKLFDIHL